MAAPHVQLHRYGIFRRTDGVCVHFGSIAWAGSPGLPVPVTGSSPKGAAADLYILPMDDDAEHWTRLVAEDVAAAHPDPQVAQAAGVERLRHIGGQPHPDHEHVRLGGTLAWEGDLHPHAQEVRDRLNAMPLPDLIAHAHGPTFKGHIT